MGGRPAGYNPDVHPILAEQYAREGCINREIAARFEISESTFYQWCRDHPEIREGIKRGKKPVDAYVEKALLKQAVGGNVTACIYWLKNRRPDRWRDKQEVEHSGTLSWVELVKSAAADPGD